MGSEAELALAASMIQSAVALFEAGGEVPLYLSWAGSRVLDAPSSAGFCEEYRTLLTRIGSAIATAHGHSKRSRVATGYRLER